MTEYFTNPYNFVALEEKCDKQSNRQIGNLTGKIKCSLTTLTEVFIPNDTPAEEVAVDFFHYPTNEVKGNDTKFWPVIPGSEIRGVIRSVFEAAFNGCLSQVNVEPFHRRSMDKKHAGLLYRENGEWKLREAYAPKVKEGQGEKVENQEGHIGYFKNGWLYDEKKKGSKKSFIHLSEKADKPKFAFYPKSHKEKYEIVTPEMIELFKEVLTIYQQNSNTKTAENTKHSGYKQYKDLFDKIESGQEDLQLPVYYSYVGNGSIGYLAPAVYSQEVFEHTLQAILDKHGSYGPCSSKEGICLACHLFGYVHESDMKASRIRVTDAESSKAVCRVDEITLPILETPKPGAVEFYTKKVKGADYWTYDYKKNRENGNNRNRQRLTLNEIQIRGRKFYWHHRPVKKNWQTGLDASREIKIRPIESGNHFIFELYFERLTDLELNQLCNVMDINHSSKHAHKIGRAKPLGFGSVQVQIEEIIIRKFNVETGDFLLSIKKREDFLNNKIPKDSELLELLKFEPQLHEKSVSYPKVNSKLGHQTINDGAGHQWFTKNNNGKKHFEQLLPKVTEEISKDPKNGNNKWLKVLDNRK